MVPKRDVDLKSPSQRLGSAGTLALYGMTAGGGRFFGVFIFEGLGVVERLHAVAACRLRRRESEVECPVRGILDWGRGGVVTYDVHVVLCTDAFGTVHFRRRGGVHWGGGGAPRSSYTDTRRWSVPLYVDGGVCRSPKSIIKIHGIHNRY